MEKLVLKNSPISYVLVQLMFPAVPNLDAKFPQIHEKIRTIGFPNPITKHGKQVKINDAGVEVTDDKMFGFLSLDKTSAIHLSSESFVYETSKYTGFENFIENTITALKTIHETINIVGMNRIGLRFINLIEIENNNVAHYLERDLIALEQTPNDEGIVFNVMESYRKTADNQDLIIRLTKSMGGKAVPNDLVNPNIKILKSAAPEKLAALLDIDHIKLYEGEEFDLKNVELDLISLHKKIYEVFTRSVTKAALGDWS